MASFAPRSVRYQALTLIQHGPIFEIAMGTAQSANRKPSTADTGLHRELAEIRYDVFVEPSVRVAFIRSEDKGFSTGGDPYFIEQMADDFDVRTHVWHEARDLVHDVINCDKPTISAIHGPAVGAELATELLANASIAARDARIVDDYTRLGMAAGDHAAIVWPLLYGMAKVKYYLLLCESITGEEAEHIGLISLTVPESELVNHAFEVAKRLAAGS